MGVLLLGAGVAAPVLAVVPSLPAQAQAQTPTNLKVWVTPKQVSYTNRTVTVSGTLETAATPAQPVPGAVVSLVIPDQGTVAVKVTASGKFSYLDPKVVVPGEIEASYAGSASYAPASSSALLKPASVLPARIVIGAITPVPYLHVATVTGTVQMQLPGGSWVPSPGASVLPSDQCDGAVLQQSAGIDGGFTFAVWADPTSTCTVTTTASLSSWSGDATSARVVVPLAAFPVYSCGPLGPDENPSPVRDIGFAVHLCYEDSAGGVRNYAGRPVQLYYQAPAGGSARLMATVRTSARGVAQADVSGYLPHGGLAAGEWIWEATASAHYMGLSTRPFGAVITVPTRLRGTRIRTRHHRSRLTGRLTYRRRHGPVAGARVIIERRRHRHWRRAGTALTNARGVYRFRLRRRLTGRYRVLFRGAPLPGAQASFGTFLRSRSRVTRFR